MACEFLEGETYTATDWFTGGIHSYKCISRTKDTATFQVIYAEIDGVHQKEPEIFQIHNDNGQEYIVLYEYKEQENRIYAK